MSGLQTPPDMLANAAADLRRARTALGDARDWLAADWRPSASSFTSEQAAARSTAREVISSARSGIDAALLELDEAAGR